MNLGMMLEDDDMTFGVIRGQGQGKEMTSVPYRDYFLYLPCVTSCKNTCIVSLISSVYTLQRCRLRLHLLNILEIFTDKQQHFSMLWHLLHNCTSNDKHRLQLGIKWVNSVCCLCVTWVIKMWKMVNEAITQDSNCLIKVDIVITSSEYSCFDRMIIQILVSFSPR